MSHLYSAKPRLVIVSGSSRPESTTRHTLKCIEGLSARRGFAPEFVCGRDLDLPIYDPPTSDQLPSVQRWREAVKAADALIFGSPEYHGTFSGVLKNMIDYLEFEHIAGKPIGLIATSGNAKTGIATLNALRLVFRALHAPVIVEQAAIWGGDFAAETKQMKPEGLEQVLGVIDGLSRELQRTINGYRRPDAA